VVIAIVIQTDQSSVLHVRVDDDTIEVVPRGRVLTQTKMDSFFAAGTRAAGTSSAAALRADVGNSDDENHYQDDHDDDGDGDSAEVDLDAHFVDLPCLQRGVLLPQDPVLALKLEYNDRVKFGKNIEGGDTASRYMYNFDRRRRPLLLGKIHFFAHSMNTPELVCVP